MQEYINRFNETVKRFDERINAIKAELQEKETAKQKAEQRYQAMLTADASGEGNYSADDLQKAKQEADDAAIAANHVKQVIEDRIAALDKAKQRQLELIYVEARNAYNNAEKEMIEQHTKLMNEVREYQAMAILKISEGRSLFDQAAKMVEDLRIIARGASKDDHRSPHSRLQHVPEKVIPKEHEYEEALRRGKLPLWVQQYQDAGGTGEEVKGTFIKNFRGLLKR